MAIRTEARSRNSRNVHTACISAACASAALALVAGCSTSTTETNVWKAPSSSAGPLRNIAVFGGRVGETDRRTLEDGYVAELAAYGVHATQSYTLFPQSPVPPDADAIRTTLESAGYDGALVSALKNASETVVVPPEAGWAGGFYGPGGYWGTGGAVYPATVAYVKFETMLWSTTSGKMVWSATTQTENPTSGKAFVASLTKAVVPSLAKAGLFAPKEGQPVSLLH